MLSTLISSKTRIKLLLKFFLNSNTVGYLRGLEAEFGESSNAIRLELNRFEEAGMLRSFSEGNKKFFQANTEHPLFGEIHNIIIKHVGIDRILEQVVQRMGKLDKVYLTGDFAKGSDSPIIDLIFIGDPDKTYLTYLVEKVEAKLERKLRYIIYQNTESDVIPWDSFAVAPLLLWQKEIF